MKIRRFGVVWNGIVTILRRLKKGYIKLLLEWYFGGQNRR